MLSGATRTSPDGFVHRLNRRTREEADAGGGDALAALGSVASCGGVTGGTSWVASLATPASLRVLRSST
jgi:hypothetical protein